ncbi:MAG TPA: hypothetical protein VE573_18030 [Nitrososphaeraceae archaeon]|jgi:hypothetical protein|nr:hypothetical protein [Nitrososphaeraceae archaeon]
MSYQEDDFTTEGEQKPRERLQLIDTLKAPIIEMGRNLGYEVVENYDLGAGPIHVCWTFKPGSESLPDMRVGFICIPEVKEGDISSYSSPQSQFSINEAIARAMINLMDKLVLVVPSEMMTKKISDSIESMPDRSILQLRKYVTVLTPSTLVSKTRVKGARERDSENTQSGEVL